MAGPAEPITGIRLTQRGRVVVAMLAMSGLANLLNGDPHTRLAFALLLGPLLADWLATPRQLGNVRVRLQPRRVAARTPFRERVQLELPPGHPPVRDLRVKEPATQSGREGWGWQPLLATEGPAGGRNEVELRCRSRTRSHRVERVIELSTTFPLGLVRARAVHRVPAELITEPGRVALDRDLLRRASRQHTDPEAPRRNPGGEFHSLREYQSGDDARSVHPLRSAATGVLVRRELRADPPQEWDLVLDLRLAPDRPLRRRGPDEVILPRHVWQAFEWQLGACATLLDRLLAEGQRGTLLALHADGNLRLPLGDRDSRIALTHLASVLPGPWLAADHFLTEHLSGRPCLWLPAGGAWPEDEWQAAGVEPLVVQSPREMAR